MTKKKDPIPEIPDGCYLIDSHCHLDMYHAGDPEEILLAARRHRVFSILTIGIDEKSSHDAVSLAAKHSMVKASIGIHPHDVAHIDSNTWHRLRKLAANNRKHIVAYGEIGLDYAKNYSPKEVQLKYFKEQLELAKELDLPVIIHDRDAHDDCLAILKEAAPFQYGGVMHCFSGDIELAEKIVDLGFYISIPGVVTFKNGTDLQKVVEYLPLEAMLIETDGPFLAPVPWRGKINEPAYLPYIAQKIAQLKDISIEDVARQTSANTQKLFRYKIKD